MQDFTRKLLTEWRKLELPFADKKIILAVSGGADSMALAFAVKDLQTRKKLQNKFIIAHFNHNLRGEESKKDSEFVKESAKRSGFEFVLGTAKKTEISKGNLEQTARNLRYEFLCKTARKVNAHAVLTAHTLNDQAETFLLNLIRGSGIEGLSAMKTVRKISEKDDILLVRPLLSWAKRIDTEKFVEANKIEFRHDLMNDDLNFKRVRIRKELIPLLESYNPNIIETLANTTDLLRDEADLIDELIAEKSELNEITKSEKLEIKWLKRFSMPLFYKILRMWLSHQRDDLRSLDFKHFEAIKNLIFSRKSGREVELPNFEKVLKQDGNLVFKKNKG